MKVTERATVEYVCEDCKRVYGSRERAEQCCACIECGGPTTPDERVKNKRTRGYDLRCTWCEIRRDVKAQQDRVRRQETDVENAKGHLAHEEQELEKDRAVLVVLTATRDALPPKPRVAKPKKEES